jgi:hypothetical protein
VSAPGRGEDVAVLRHRQRVPIRDFGRAAEEMKLALANAPDPQKPGLQKQIEQLQAGRDINAPQL